MWSCAVPCNLATFLQMPLNWSWSLFNKSLNTQQSWVLDWCDEFSQLTFFIYTVELLITGKHLNSYRFLLCSHMASRWVNTCTEATQNFGVLAAAYSLQSSLIFSYWEAQGSCVPAILLSEASCFACCSFRSQQGRKMVRRQLPCSFFMKKWSPTRMPLFFLHCCR